MTNTHVCRCKTCDRQMGGVIPLTGAAWQLQKELSLAEEGLANYAQDHKQYVDWATPQLERLGREMVENERLRDCWAEALANYAKQNTEVETLKRSLRESWASEKRLAVEVETLKRLAAQLHAIRNESLTCAMACPHSCNACERLYSLIRRALPQEAEHGQKG